MEEKHKSLLRTERLYLTNDLQPHVESIVDGLLATDVLNDNMKQEIMVSIYTLYLCWLYVLLPCLSAVVIRPQFQRLLL